MQCVQKSVTRYVQKYAHIWKLKHTRINTRTHIHTHTIPISKQYMRGPISLPFWVLKIKNKTPDTLHHCRGLGKKLLSSSQKYTIYKQNKHNTFFLHFSNPSSAATVTKHDPKDGTLRKIVLNPHFKGPTKGRSDPSVAHGHIPAPIIPSFFKS